MLSDTRQEGDHSLHGIIMRWVATPHMIRRYSFLQECLQKSSSSETLICAMARLRLTERIAATFHYR